MSALEASVKIFTQICELAETYINNHFKQIDSLENKSHAARLRLVSLSELISSELKIKQQECFYCISLYLNNRPDLEVRRGENGGICRIKDDNTKILMTPKECALRHYKNVKEKAQFLIDEEFSKAEEELEKQGINKKVRLNFKDLGSKISNILHIKDYVVYHCLKEYIEEERVDLVIELGRYGGLMRRYE